jgi:monoamine oxidase
MTDRLNCIVVGGGLAGLRAAERLVESGATVRVLEARDRVGGRTHRKRIGELDYDLGAQWIGPTQDRMYALLERLGLQTFRQHVTGTKVLELRGKISAYKRSIPSLSAMHSLELDRLIRRLDGLTARIDPTDPLADPRAHRWDARTVEVERQKILSKQVRGLVDTVVRVVFGSEPSELSLLHFLYTLRLGGGLMRVWESEGGAQQDRLVGGMWQVAPAMAAGLGDAVVTDAPVVRILQDGDGVRVLTPRGEHAADRVVVAMPPMLAGRIAYDPILPSSRDQLSQRMPMGATIKCIAVYERAFWREQGFSGEVVCDGAPLSAVFDACSADGTHFALIGLSVGAAARRFGRLPEAERAKQVAACFTRWFGEQASDPIAYGDLDWAGERWTRGAPVGVMQPGAWTMAGPCLRKPVGRIHWSGTESARVWAGYMEGALESGERAADEVLAAL